MRNHWSKIYRLYSDKTIACIIEYLEKKYNTTVRTFYYTRFDMTDNRDMRNENNVIIFDCAKIVYEVPFKFLIDLGKEALKYETKEEFINKFKKNILSISKITTGEDIYKNFDIDNDRSSYNLHLVTNGAGN